MLKILSKSSKGRRRKSTDIAEIRKNLLDTSIEPGIEVEEDECKQEDLGKMEAAHSFRSIPFRA